MPPRPLALALLVALPACAPAGDAPAPSADARLVIGTGRIASVVDGDTVRLEGRRASLRLLGLDTEETPHDPDRRAALLAMDRDAFRRYAARQRGDAPRPVKYPTPLGIAATERARALLPPGTRVRLERDRPGAPDDDAYGRTLCWLWILGEDGAPDRLFNLAMVREGWSPAFVKYGRSARFDAALAGAQRRARAEGLGIWADDARAYPDYPERLAWWERRARALAALDDIPHAIRLGDKGAIRTLLRRVGEIVTVAGVVGDTEGPAVRPHDGGVTLRVGEAEPIEVELVGRALGARYPEERVHGEWVVASGPLDREGSPLDDRVGHLRVVVRDAMSLTLPGERER